MINLNDIKKHCRNREYMANIQRSTNRVKATGEVFTPTSLVQDILIKIEEKNPQAFKNKYLTFIDPCCGDGQFLSEILIKKLEYVKKEDGCVLEEDVIECLSTIYGIDIMPDNIEECKERLSGYCKSNDTIKNIVNKNIRVADSLQIIDYEKLFTS